VARPRDLNLRWNSLVRFWARVNEALFAVKWATNSVLGIVCTCRPHWWASALTSLFEVTDRMSLMIFGTYIVFLGITCYRTESAIYPSTSFNLPFIMFICNFITTMFLRQAMCSDQGWGPSIGLNYMHNIFQAVPRPTKILNITFPQRIKRIECCHILWWRILCHYPMWIRIPSVSRSAFVSPIPQIPISSF
jgi:hypothetical protein